MLEDTALPQRPKIWIDLTRNRELEARIENAKAHYLETFGYAADHIYLNPKDAAAYSDYIAGVKIFMTNAVQPGHFSLRHLFENGEVQSW